MLDTPANPSTNTIPGAWSQSTLRDLLLRPEAFVVCVELATSRGTITEQSGRRVLTLARQLVENPRFDALCVTDNPGGNAMLAADTLGTDLIARGQEVIINLSCKDWNRNALQSRAWALASAGFDNILALSGDYPHSGYSGQASGVFDIDSVALLDMLNQMNRGLKITGPSKASNVTMECTRFLTGAVVNNFKRYEREVMPQYLKLAKKIESGAQFIINQVGYDARKQDELLKYMDRHGLDAPVLANVFVLNARVAKVFHSGRIPGCLVTDALLAQCEKHGAAEDKGKSFFLELAAKQVAIARGLGYRGVYFGGHLKYEDYETILDLVESFSPDDWRTFARDVQFSQPDEFFYLEQDPDTALAADRVNRQYLASREPNAPRRLRPGPPISYRFSRFLHDEIFARAAPLFNVGKRIFARIDKSGRFVRRATHRTELALKVLAFDCRDCGDCSLPDVAYLCPESQCAKNQRNGPCGGTHDGQCEVGEKQCIWALAYDRLKSHGEELDMLNRPVVFKDAALKGTSAWANTFLERDHHARAAEKQDPEKPK
ncbi:MAG: methylenetetrahydrofolate reductase [Planctomycetaceae bacterium]|nr:methylenetetrahydrofolate reductase [Planctomycetaceae bacterium]